MQQWQFIDPQDQLNMFRTKFCPSSGAQDWDFLQHMVAALRTPAYHNSRTLYHML